MDINEEHQKHRDELWAMQNWRSWGSWFSWGSPVGLGLFFVEIGAFLTLLHYAGLLR
ncbi:MAG TPA: hypothetical protein VMT81_03570 [Candidatus Paceibacterota bacterium]|nr:hypothetical protein [Candidatus Paceibacterota bacterium]